MTLPITVNTTWTAANSPYVLQNDIAIQNAATLTIQAGVQVIGARLLVNSGAGLVVNGVAGNQVRFGNDNVQVKAGGSLKMNYGRMDLNSDLLLNSGALVAAANFKNNSFAANVVQIDAGSFVPLFAVNGNMFDAGSTVYFDGGTISGTVQWPKLANVTSYYMYNDVSLNNGAQLTIDAGNTIGGARLFVNSGSELVAAGVIGNQIVFGNDNVWVRAGGSLKMNYGRMNLNSDLLLNSGALVLAANFKNNSFAANVVQIDAGSFVPLFAANGNTFDAGSTVYFDGGTISGTVQWPKLANVTSYYMYNDVSLNNGAQLTIDAGNTIGGARLFVNSGSELVAAGVSGNRVVFGNDNVWIRAGGSLKMNYGRMNLNSDLLLNSGALVAAANFKNNSFAANVVQIDAGSFVPLFAVNGNMFDAGSTVYFDGGTISGTVQWPKLANVTSYYMYNDVSLNNGAQLTIDAGNTIGGARLFVNSGSELVAAGVIGNQIVFGNDNVWVRAGGSLKMNYGRMNLNSDLLLNSGALVLAANFKNNSFAANVVQIDAGSFVPLFAANGNTFDAGSTVYFDGGTISGTVQWPKLANVTSYYMYNDVSLNNGAQLTINAGNTIGGARLFVNSGSELVVAGVSGNRVVFGNDNVQVKAGGSLKMNYGRMNLNSDLLLNNGALVLAANFKNNSFAANVVQIDAGSFVPLFAVSGNKFDAGSTVYFDGGTISGTVQWPKLANVTSYYMYNDVSLNNGAQLTIDAGNTIGGARLLVNSGSVLVARGVSLTSDLTLDALAGGDVRESTFAANVTLTINAASTALLRDNKFLGMGSSTVVGTGDSTRTIDLVGNFWGTVSIPTIEARIQDKDDLSTRPQINVNPPVALNTLSGLVWQDINLNGINDYGETGKSGVTVRLFDAGANAAPGGGDDLQFGIDKVTNAEGYYAFTGLVPTHRYFLEVVQPANFSFTTLNQGNDYIDSDVDSFGHTVVTSPWGNGSFDPTWDAGVVTNAPEIDVDVDGADLFDGLSRVLFRQAQVGSVKTKEFTITNVGTAMLTLQQPSIINGSGYSISQPLGSLSLAPGATTTFEVTMATSSVGSRNATLSFGNNDADEGPFSVQLNGSVVTGPEIQVLDGTTNIADNTGFVNFGSTPFGATITKTFTVKNTGDSSMTVQPVTVPAGFTVTSNFAANQVIAARGQATFAVRMNGDSSGTVGGQMQFTNTDADEGPFNFTVFGAVVAPEIQVFDGAIEILDSTGSVSFGSTVVGTTVSKTITVKNTGNIDLTVNPLTVPTGFTVTSNFTANQVIAPGASATIVVRFEAATAGTATGELSFTNNDGNESPFNFPVTGTATVAAPAVQYMDDGDAGFSTVGTWSNASGRRLTDVKSVAGAVTAKKFARWEFAIASPGVYRVMASWRTGGGTVTYRVLTDVGGTDLGGRTLSQATAPTDLIDAGDTASPNSKWGQIANVNAASTRLVVQLSNLGTGNIFADSIRIERIGDLP